jgi:glycolate oxidase iron-sulfur subunit
LPPGARLLLTAILRLLPHRRCTALALRAARLACRLRLAHLAVRLFAPRVHRAHFLDLAASLGGNPDDWRTALTTPTGVAGAAARRFAPAAAGEEPVLLFRGCVTPVLYPGALAAAHTLLSAGGIEAHCPGEQTCCGAAHWHLGARESARRLARRNIEVFEAAGEGTIVAESAGCGAMLQSYGELLADDADYAERARRFSRRVEDLSARLARGQTVPGTRAASTMAPGDSAPLRVVLQTPCHLRHLQGEGDAPAALLAALPGCETVAAPEADLCCGAGGLYQLLQPGMAAALGERKAEVLAASGAPLCVTSDPGCRLQLEGRLRRRGMRCVHLAELVAGIQGREGDQR